MVNVDNYYTNLSENPDIAIQVTDAVVTDDVAGVSVRLWLGGHEYYTAKGSAKRDPVDSNNPEIALKLATGRAIRQLGRELLKDAQHLVREADNVIKKQKEASKLAFERKKIRNENRNKSDLKQSISDLLA